ncbi:hypothetical protein TPB0596_28480 [Tsukamurella pulmonis]|uniref:Secreted protein n=1 Tax=Tsukamurella pulmonis TaxID=47312 RepID=A0A1H1E3Q3_9ACTN|nr:hypothetical protein [Tsukamurella pulmonis]KXO92102.1 hypothetical protein AXK56_03115 [Tsukamurella pulmonis]KXP09749.1 hypothetical protein AXK57_12960 [Tsukamurella pulmonis]RDH11359.1 hypothetical protein DVB88_12860 [Tsukamurella pulmonis]SDQ83109.1 hypothetical protein SAMN04489765_2010 [Tsukamurella pulmonis]SUP21370.1 Uncharacterised protein [Tsukamurella pulmonis]
MTTLVRRAIATALTAGTVLALAPAVANASGSVTFRGTVTGGTSIRTTAPNATATWVGDYDDAGNLVIRTNCVIARHELGVIGIPPSPLPPERCESIQGIDLSDRLLVWENSTTGATGTARSEYDGTFIVRPGKGNVNVMITGIVGTAVATYVA